MLLLQGHISVGSLAVPGALHSDSKLLQLGITYPLSGTVDWWQAANRTWISYSSSLCLYQMMAHCYDNFFVHQGVRRSRRRAGGISHAWMYSTFFVRYKGAGSHFCLFFCLNITLISHVTTSGIGTCIHIEYIFMLIYIYIYIYSHFCSCKSWRAGRLYVWTSTNYTKYHLINQSINRSTNQSINESQKRCVDRSSRLAHPFDQPHGQQQQSQQEAVVLEVHMVHHEQARVKKN